MMTTLQHLPWTLSVCRAPLGTGVPHNLTQSRFFALTHTPQECSLVTETHLAPQGWIIESGWAALMVEGPLDFSLTGILASIANPLAQRGISIFAVSTYDTDYILVKEPTLQAAMDALRDAGFHITGTEA